MCYFAQIDFLRWKSVLFFSLLTNQITNTTQFPLLSFPLLNDRLVGYLIFLTEKLSIFARGFNFLENTKLCGICAKFNVTKLCWLVCFYKWYNVIGFLHLQDGLVWPKSMLKYPCVYEILILVQFLGFLPVFRDISHD